MPRRLQPTACARSTVIQASGGAPSAAPFAAGENRVTLQHGKTRSHWKDDPQTGRVVCDFSVAQLSMGSGANAAVCRGWELARVCAALRHSQPWGRAHRHADFLRWLGRPRPIRLDGPTRMGRIRADADDRVQRCGNCGMGGLLWPQSLELHGKHATASGAGHWCCPRPADADTPARYFQNDWLVACAATARLVAYLCMVFSGRRLQ